MEINVTEQKNETVNIVKKSTTKPKLCPRKYSNWFLTINSNKNVNAMNNEDQTEFTEKFKQIISDLFNVKMKDFIILKGSAIGEKFGLPRECSREELEARVEKVSIQYVTEIGPNNGFLHIHGMVAIYGRGVNKSLDYAGIRQFLMERLGYAPHFNSILYRDAKQNLEAYIRKHNERD